MYLLLAVFALATVLPRTWRLAGWAVILHIVSFPLVFGLVLGGLSMVLARRVLRQRPGRGLRMLAVGVVGAVALFHLGEPVLRGWWSDPGTPKSGDLVVVSFNSHYAADLTGDLDGLIRTRHPQVIVLPETLNEVAAGLAARARSAGMDYQLFTEQTNSSRSSETTVMIDSSLGKYAKDESRSRALGEVRVIPADSRNPVIVGVHPTSPEGVGVNAGVWQRAGRAAVRECPRTPGSIVAGDFNATVDHPQFAALGSCVDAASQVGRGGEGTWPSWLPAPLASPIDHVLLDPQRWQVVDFSTHRVPNSDHRLIISTLRPK